MAKLVSRKAGEIAPPKKVAITLSVNLITAVVIPLILDYFSKSLFSLTDEVIIGFLIAITMSLAELVFLTQHIYDTEIKQAELWEQKHAIDGVISNMRANMHSIIENYHSEGFYFEHYKSELLWIQNRLQDTIGRKEITLDRHHIDATHALLSIFDAPQHNTFRATHLLWEMGDEFDVTYQVYFNAWLDKLKEGKVTEIRRVFVYRDLNDLCGRNARKLLAFHLGTSLPIHGKIVSRSELGRFKADFNITDGVEDFGVFSDMYLYLGSSRSRDQIAGVFSRDEARIKKYIACFDALWNSPAAQSLSKFVQDKIDEVELFDGSFILPPRTPYLLQKPERENSND